MELPLFLLASATTRAQMAGAAYTHAEETFTKAKSITVTNQDGVDSSQQTL